MHARRAATSAVENRTVYANRERERIRNEDELVGRQCVGIVGVIVLQRHKRGLDARQDACHGTHPVHYVALRHKGVALAHKHGDLAREQRAAGFDGLQCSDRVQSLRCNFAAVEAYSDSRRLQRYPFDDPLQLIICFEARVF